MIRSLLFALLLACYSMSFAQKLVKPNILIILADDLGYHDVSYLGTPDIRTPNIDGLCRAGMRFDKFYSNSPVCSPSRASLMSGRYPELVGVPGLIRNKPEDNFGYMTPGIELLPALLKKADYQTAIIGKWNLGLEAPNLPNQKGFDHFHGWLDDMMDDYWKHLRNGNNYLRLNDQPITPEGHATDLFTQWAVDYIKGRKTGTKPFFMYLAYNAPHAPIQPTEEFLNKVKARQPGVTEKRAKLVALIEHMDDGIGKVIGALKAKGELENTIVVFLSDNGGQLDLGANNGNVRDGKGSMYEGGIRIPAFVTWPRYVKAGSASAERLMQMDIYPTLAEIAGVPIAHKIDGVSFLPLLKESGKKMADRPLFFIRREGGGYGAKTSSGLINGNFKLLQNTPTQPFELYDLSKDSLETRNLFDADVPQRRIMNQLLMKQAQRGGSVPWQKPEKDQ